MIKRLIHLINLNGSLEDSIYNVSKYAINIKKNCQNYEIIIWNESNLPEEITTNKYYLYALKNKKYAFAADVARVWLLWKLGGIYIDTDVEIIKNLDDLLVFDFVMGFENKYTLSTGFIGACANNKILEEVWQLYYSGKSKIKSRNFLKIPNVEYFSIIAQKFGFVLNGNSQLLNNNCIKDQSFFSPFFFYDSSKSIQNVDTTVIHHFNASWKNNSFKWIIIKAIVFLMGDKFFLILRKYHRIVRQY